jgi:endogenous inhibitor of DNA gyrase (YacG/DUF329 family)
MRKGICPKCRKEWEAETNADFPFCSNICRMLDLYSWFSGEYVISEPLPYACDDEEAADGIRKTH